MERLSDDYLASCPRDGGLILRGHSMTRIETFVDAAFAFTFTLLVISIDEIPRSPVQLVETAKDIPAFLFSALLMGQLWLVHVGWSRIFGISDRITVVLSLAIVMLVLIFVYPLKLMLQSGIFYFSEGLIGADVFIDSEEWTESDVSNMFVFMAAGVLSLAVIVAALYLNGLRFRAQLCLNAFEVFISWKRIMSAGVVGVTAIICGLTASMALPEVLPWSGLGYLSLFVTMPLAARIFKRFYPPPPTPPPG